jgi:hypothetical protein
MKAARIAAMCAAIVLGATVSLAPRINSLADLTRPGERQSSCKIQNWVKVTSTGCDRQVTVER